RGDLVITRWDSERVKWRAVVKLVASTTIADVQRHYQTAEQYGNLLSADLAWVICFCPFAGEMDGNEVEVPPAPSSSCKTRICYVCHDLNWSKVYMRLVDPVCAVRCI